MLKKHLKNKDIFIILVAATIMLLVFFLRGYTVGHDSKFHIGNIIELTNQLKNNIFFPSRVYGTMANNFGYGTGIFYPMLPHLFAAYINLCINNPLISIKIVYYISLVLSGITMYKLSLRISKNNKVALLSSIMYMAFPYHLSNIYVRDALAENYLFVFLPMILSGIYELFKGDKRKFYLLFTIGYIGGVLSHLTMMIYFTIFVLIFLAMRFKDTIKNIKYFIVASVFILLIISPFVVPMIENKVLGEYRVFQDSVMVQGTWGNGITPYKYLNYDAGSGDKIKYYIDIVCLVLLVLSMANYSKYRNKIYDYIIMFGAMSLIMATIIFPWDYLPISLRMFQYPWRFETFAALFICLLAPLYAQSFKSQNTHYILIILMLCFSYSTTNWNNYTFIELEDESIYEVAMGWQQEYLPVKVYENIDYYNNRNHDIIVKDKKAKVEVNIDEVPRMDFTLFDDAKIEFPRLYYYGYTLKDVNGNKYEIYENENGFIEADLKAGIYSLDYTGTTLDNICKCLSILGLICFSVFVLKKEVIK